MFLFKVLNLKQQKIGDLYQIKTGTTHQMVYGIQQDIASKVGITSGDYTFVNDGQQIIAFKDAQQINKAFQLNKESSNYTGFIKE